jgi:predicted PurR-regulated permease PerM
MSMGVKFSNNPGEARLDIFAKRVIVAILILAVTLLIWQLMPVLLMAFIGILIAIMLRGFAGLLSRFLPISRNWSLLIVLLLIVGVGGLFIWLAGSLIGNQLAQFTELIPTSKARLQQMLRGWSFGEYVFKNISNSKLDLDKGIQIFTTITQIAFFTVDAVVSLFVVIFTSIYFSVNPDVYTSGLIALVPKEKSPRLAEVLEATAHTLRYWMLGQAASMIIVALLTGLGLWLVGVPLAFLLGLITGLLNIVPYLGAVAGAVPGCLVALTQDWNAVIYTILVYVAVHQLDGDIVSPLAQKQAINLPPALIIFAVVAFGYVFGLLGILVAAPLTVVVIVWVKMLYVQDVLEKPIDII